MRKWLVEVVFPSEAHREILEEEKKSKNIDALYALEVEGYERDVWVSKKKEDVLQPLCKGVGYGPDKETAVKMAEEEACSSLPNVIIVSKYGENIFPGEILEKEHVSWLKGELRRREKEFGFEEEYLIKLTNIFGVAYITNIMAKNLLWATKEKPKSHIDMIKKLNMCIVASQRGTILGGK